MTQVLQLWHSSASPCQPSFCAIGFSTRCSALLHLLPFSLSELERRHPIKVSSLGHGLPRRKSAGHADVMKTLFRGFYPRIHDKGLESRRWLRDYYQAYVERDAFGRFVRLCAGRNGQLLNLSSLANDCGITHTTAKRWLRAISLPASDSGGISSMTSMLRQHWSMRGIAPFGGKE